MSALQVLGYSQREIENAIKNVDKDRLIVWIINELDNASILEIISNTTELK
jgi:Holliday junction resolvasome RuvABC DNA-binding subunit